jgi:hypothetical protein
LKLKIKNDKQQTEAQKSKRLSRIGLFRPSVEKVTILNMTIETVKIIATSQKKTTFRIWKAEKASPQNGTRQKKEKG